MSIFTGTLVHFILVRDPARFALGCAARAETMQIANSDQLGARQQKWRRPWRCTSH